ncbi:protein tyrosine phosphatase [Bosea sp. F3-2]|uniref:fused DSP-PTPase phosphatase/NAD kinase-like protein n=1 Tax=Bosea sp. F3-2 TaxID=2599640 RepID=UPI0011EE3E50|nr:sulfur transferase domain-containing protein [Bosea sp. F3-2]QEL24696.1 protein tyrosine phosphatase [Bosea sp. F3-2]
MLTRLRSDEERYARRMARIARWDRPIESRGQRLRAWTNMLLVDHGIFRLAYLNTHRVTPRLWRSAQPAPHQIASFARRGIRTIVNLRGGREHGSWPLQKEACERHGIALIDFILRSRGAPDRDTILNAKGFFESLEEPVLVHCKSGADRAGFFSALYLLIHEKRPLAEAMRQLSLRYGHFRFAKTGILDAFFEAYRREGEAKGIAFLDWVETVYDPERLEREFKPGVISSLIADRLIRRE